MNIKNNNNTPVKRAFAKFFIRTGRGGGLLSRFTDVGRDILDGTVYVFAIKGLFGVEVTMQMLVAIVIAKKVCEYTIGHIDEHVGFWKFENDYTSREINPFNKEMLERIKRIEDVVVK